jgi:hypothetical protein
MKDNVTPLATAISSMYEEKVKMLHGTKSSDAQIKLVACASRISIHEQKFGYTFLGEIIFIFPHLVDKPKVHALEFITASCDVEERVFNTLKYDTIVKMMRYRQVTAEIALHIATN